MINDAVGEVARGLSLTSEPVSDVGVFEQRDLASQIQGISQDHIGITGQRGVVGALKITVRVGER